MIVCHRYRFIFLKTTKTASTAVEIALSTHCGDCDIITPISDAYEAMRLSSAGRGPQHYLFSPGERRNIHAIRPRRQAGNKFYNHLPAVEAEALLGADVWGTYFKFCVVRNPFDRAVSDYYWRHRKEPRIDFSDYVDSGALTRLKKRGSGIYLIHGGLAVDAVCRYESLASDLESIRTRLAIPEALVLPVVRSGFRPAGRHYRECYGPGDREKVARMFADEIDRFGYSF